MLNIGCHLSISSGLVGLAKNAAILDANTFQFFVRNPRGGGVRDFTNNEIEQFQKISSENNFAKFVVHAPYTLNLCAKNPKIIDFTKKAMIEDIKIVDKIPGNYYNFHPGFHVGSGIEKGINMIVNALRDISQESKHTKILLETMSGKGSEIGSKFEEIAEIISCVDTDDKIGVCLDTCHVFAAGYDIVNNLDSVIERFDKIVGLEKLCAIHLNDSMMPFNSKKDRHACIGDGRIGSEALINFVNQTAFKDIPFILETPNDEIGYAKEISFFRRNCNDN